MVCPEASAEELGGRLTFCKDYAEYTVASNLDS
jgi:hypothetical protein